MKEILAILANGMIVLAYFFNPELRKQREQEKIWAIFHDLEEKLAKALVDKDMRLVDQIRHWLKEYRDKYDYLKGKTK